MRKYAHRKECPWECGKFGSRAGKSPPNNSPNTNNVNLFFPLQNTTKKEDKKKNKINNNKQKGKKKTEKKSRYAVSRYAVTPLRVLLTTAAIDPMKTNIN